MGFFQRWEKYLPKNKNKEELDEHYKKVKTEKGDMLAMLLAAFKTIVPVILLVVLLIFLPMYLLFGR